MSLASNTQITTWVGGRKVLTSGVVHLEGDLPIKIQVSNLVFVFSFAKDEGGPRYVGEAKQGELHLTLFNHSNTLGEGFLDPIPVAVLNEEPLSLTYFVNTLDPVKGVRRFEYVFYLGAE